MKLDIYFNPGATPLEINVSWDGALYAESSLFELCGHDRTITSDNSGMAVVDGRPLYCYATWLEETQPGAQSHTLWLMA